VSTGTDVPKSARGGARVLHGRTARALTPAWGTVFKQPGTRGRLDRLGLRRAHVHRSELGRGYFPGDVGDLVLLVDAVDMQRRAFQEVRNCRAYFERGSASLWPVERRRSWNPLYEHETGADLGESSARIGISDQVPFFTRLAGTCGSCSPQSQLAR